MDYISHLCQAKAKPRLQGDLEESITMMYFIIAAFGWLLTEITFIERLLFFGAEGFE
jgi:hypothetical protein